MSDSTLPDLARTVLGKLDEARGHADCVAPTDLGKGIGYAREILAQELRLAVIDGTHGALRWQDPLPVPRWVLDLQALLGMGEGAACPCDLCHGAAAREAETRAYQARMAAEAEEEKARHEAAVENAARTADEVARILAQALSVNVESVQSPGVVDVVIPDPELGGATVTGEGLPTGPGERNAVLCLYVDPVLCLAKCHEGWRGDGFVDPGWSWEAGDQPLCGPDGQRLGPDATADQVAAAVLRLVHGDHPETQEA